MKEFVEVEKLNLHALELTQIWQVFGSGESHCSFSCKKVVLYNSTKVQRVRILCNSCLGVTYISSLTLRFREE